MELPGRGVGLDSLARYYYRWPRCDLGRLVPWRKDDGGRTYVRNLPEGDEELAADSRWPAFFPSPMCFVTTAAGSQVALEKVVGPTIVNRFPYVLALTFCRKRLSDRHHPRTIFTEMLERGRGVAVQFLPPGSATDRIMDAVTSVPEARADTRIGQAGLLTRRAMTNKAPVFRDAYMVYEARLVEPRRDFEGRVVYEKPWIDVGSHRVYFFEINAIQLRQDIACGRGQIRWRALPEWNPQVELQGAAPAAKRPGDDGRYAKPYTPNYTFPSAGTIAFEADTLQDGMAVKLLPPLPEDQVEVDNDRARWPCFFPASVGMITTWTSSGVPNLMPCGSTTVVSRHPLTVAACISYAAINERYAPRATLKTIRQTRRFGYGVPFVNDTIVSAIRYAGNHSIADDPRKAANAGLTVEPSVFAPVLHALPVHFDCELIGEKRLGTHVMVLGEVRCIRVRSDVTPDHPIIWCPWAGLTPIPNG